MLAWGSNPVGQLGIGTTTGRHRPVFVKLPKGTKVSALAAGKDYSLALTNESIDKPAPSTAPVGHGLLAWGGNEAGQLGTGTGNSLMPVNVLFTSVVPTSVGSGWGSVTSIAICFVPPV